MDPELLLQQAQAAIGRGADPAAVNARIAQVSGGKFADMAALQASRAPAAPKHSALSDFARMTAQSATFGFADELAGMMGGNTEASRARVAEIREERPGVALAGDLTGALATAVLPTGAAVSGVKAGAGLLGTIARGAAVGAAEGGLLGAGDTDSGSRTRGAVTGAAKGAGIRGLAAGATGVASALARRATGRGARVAGELQEAAGIRTDINSTLDELESGIDAVRREHYKPLERITAIKDPSLLAILRSPAVRRETSAIAPDVASGKRPPSFKEAQDVLIRMRRLNRRNPRFTEQIEQLDGALEKAIPDYREADAAFLSASAPQRALLQGREMWNKSAADVQREIRRLSPELQSRFRQGQLTEIVRRLEQRDQSAVGLLRQYMDAGPETTRQLRNLFADDAGYRTFQQVLNRERSAESIAATLRRLAPAAAAGAGIGAASQLMN